MRTIRPACVAAAFVLISLGGARAAAASSGTRLDAPVRGRTLALTVYRPTDTPRGTILMGSGDVGWVGLAVTMSEDLRARGFLVIGLNVRQYLGAFTNGKAHLSTSDVQDDFRTLSGFLRTQNLLPAPVIVSGVSEGAALAMLAASAAQNHDWIDGAIAMGLPEVAELAWRWTDVTAWITKRDADEPSFHAHEFIAGVAPVPLVMIQSTKDEYVPASDYQRLLETAREPKRQILINASNHRFTDRIPELQQAYMEAIRWIVETRAAQRGNR